VTAAHWLYVIGVIVVILTMIMRRNVVIPCVIFTFLIGWVYHASLVKAVQTIFNASIVAATELFSIFLIIGLMVAMLRSLSQTGADERMISPVKGLMVSPTVSYIVLAVITLVVSLFFWPTPAVPLVGALLVPVAVRAGLPPMLGAMAVALAGQGMALAGDVVIQGAPKLTASAAGVPVEMVLLRGGLLTAITGVVALALGYWLNRAEIASFRQKLAAGEVAATAEAALQAEKAEEKAQVSPGVTNFLAVFTPVVMLLVIIAMIAFRVLGGDASALLGGAAAIVMVVAVLLTNFREGFDKMADNLGDGLVFAFRVMGPIIPIAGFFFLGSPEASAKILGEGAPGYLFDVGRMLAQSIPPTGFLASFGILIVGAITGLDGSGFSGLPLVGSLAGALAPSQAGAATLGAIGQMGAIWSGGGTLVAWCSLVAVAGICGVSVLDLVRKNLIPVVVGLVVSTIVAIIIF